MTIHFHLCLRELPWNSSKKILSIIKSALNMASPAHKNTKIVKFHEALYMLNGSVVYKLNLYKPTLPD